MTLPTVCGEKPPVLILGDFPDASFLLGDFEKDFAVGDFADGDFDRSPRILLVALFYGSAPYPLSYIMDAYLLLPSY